MARFRNVSWFAAAGAGGAFLALMAARPLAPEAAQDGAAAKVEFAIDGHYVEACSCRAPCPCELVGPNMTCEGVGCYQFDHGTFGGADFSGTRMAYSLYIGKEVRLYLDAPDDAKRAALEKFSRAALAGFGPCKGAKAAKIDFGGADGKHEVKVTDGATTILSFSTEPILGGDKKTPIVHSNTQDALNPTMYQAQCLSCTYVDGEMKISLEKGDNSYFNAHMKSHGKF